MSAHEHDPGCASEGNLRQSSPCPHGVASSRAEQDPVCAMDVDPHMTAHRATEGGRPYYFCSSGCRAKFVASPATYLARTRDAPKR